MAGEERHSEPYGNVDLGFYRNLVKQYVEKHSYKSALFWADKIVSLSNGDVHDVVSYAQCLFLTRQYHRAAHLLRTNSLYQENITCNYLAARCHYEAGEYQKALDVLETPLKPSKPIDESIDISDLPGLNDLSQNMISSIQLLKGQIYKAQDNRELSAMCFKEALHADIFCFEAFDALTSHQVLTAKEERDLIKSLPLDTNKKEDASFVLGLYNCKLKKYSSHIKETVLSDAVPALKKNLELKAAEAERLYYNCNYRKCHALTEEILNKDPYHPECLPTHISCLVELKKSNALFLLAHNLLDLNPGKAVAWFAVGCFYYLTGKHDPARKYLNKAVTLDQTFGPAWLAYGHAFAIENEHDQAMAAYCRASQLMKGCHLPMLYVGLEYGLTNNVSLAEKFLEQAVRIAPDDPFVLHELGVIEFQKKDYDAAEEFFLEALDKIRGESHTVEAEKWEPLLNNLAHVCRKKNNYVDALNFHYEALLLCPVNASTYSGLGYVHALTGECSRAVELFHKALGHRRDDTFSTTMLGNVMQLLIKQNDMIEDDACVSQASLEVEEEASEAPVLVNEVDMEISD